MKNDPTKGIVVGREYTYYHGYGKSSFTARVIVTNVVSREFVEVQVLEVLEQGPDVVVDMDTPYAAHNSQLR